MLNTADFHKDFSLNPLWFFELLSCLDFDQTEGNLQNFEVLVLKTLLQEGDLDEAGLSKPPSISRGQDVLQTHSSFRPAHTPSFLLAVS